jgi:hypothetical protein
LEMGHAAVPFSLFRYKVIQHHVPRDLHWLTFPSLLRLEEIVELMYKNYIKYIKYIKQMKMDQTYSIF